MFTEDRKLRPEIASRLTEPIMKNTNIKSILTDQSVTDEEVREWVNDLFTSFEDENGEIRMYANIITTDKIYIE